MDIFKIILNKKSYINIKKQDITSAIYYILYYNRSMTYGVYDFIKKYTLEKTMKRQIENTCLMFFDYNNIKLNNDQETYFYKLKNII